MTIEEIKEMCRAVIALAETASPAPWCNESDWPRVVTRDGHQVCQMVPKLTEKTKGEQTPDTRFIAFSRSFTPMAAKALFVAIEGLELIAFMREADNRRDLSPNGLHAFAGLESIRSQFTNTQA